MSTTRSFDEELAFETISKRVYGDGSHAVRLSNSNPHLEDPVPAGTEVYVPALTLEPIVAETAVAEVYPSFAPLSDTSLQTVLEGQTFGFWTRVRVERGIDQMDSIQLEGPFEPNAQGMRQALRPFSFADLAVKLGGKTYLTGTLMGVTPDTGKARRVRLSAYAKPAVLQDCCAPLSSFDGGRNEYFETNLDYIAYRLAGFFGIQTKFLASTGAAFEQVNLAVTTKVLDFLRNLARQRGLAITSSEEGHLVFWTALPASEPVAFLREGEAPLVSVQCIFKPQNVFSHVSATEPTLLGVFAGAQHTEVNDRMKGFLRPMNIALQDALSGDLPQIVRSEMSRMYGESIAYYVEVAGWQDSLGRPWTPNTTIRVQAAAAMIYEPFDFIIRSVILRKDDKSLTARLELILPGSLALQLPERLPWEEQ